MPTSGGGHSGALPCFAQLHRASGTDPFLAAAIHCHVYAHLLRLGSPALVQEKVLLREFLEPQKALNPFCLYSCKGGKNSKTKSCSRGYPDHILQMVYDKATLAQMKIYYIATKSNQKYKYYSQFGL